MVRCVSENRLFVHGQGAWSEKFGTDFAKAKFQLTLLTPRDTDFDNDFLHALRSLTWLKKLSVSWVTGRIYLLQRQHPQESAFPWMSSANRSVLVLRTHQATIDSWMLLSASKEALVCIHNYFLHLNPMHVFSGDRVIEEWKVPPDIQLKLDKLKQTHQVCPWIVNNEKEQPVKPENVHKTIASA